MLTTAMAYTAPDTLSNLQDAFAWIVNGFTEFAEAMLSTPLFLIPIGIFAAGACIGLVKRLV